jgi:ATP-dependent DNA helicase RecG
MGKNLYSLVEQGERNDVAFATEKAALSKLAETMAAMANGQGGTLLVGFDKQKGKFTGLADPEEALDRALKAALMCDPPLIIPLPELVKVNGNTVLVVAVPQGLPHVYALKGQYLKRDGVRNVPLPERRLRQLLLLRGETEFESQPCRGAELADLDLERAEAYLAGLPRLMGETVEEALLNRGCLAKRVESYQPTNAGVLLFGREPQRFFKSAEIIVIRYPGRTMGDSFLREDVRGPLPDQIRRAESFIINHMQRGFRLDGLERETRTEYPAEVVREVIVNAVAHRSYAIRGDCIRIFFFCDRIECYSPGRLPGHVTLENLIEERFSRNEAIVQVLADMGFIERLGYGIDRMIRAMSEEDLPPPLFEETAGGFRVTLYGHGDRLLAEGVDVSRWRSLALNERQEQALLYLAKHGRITNREYQELCPEVSPETIRRDLADLVEKNLLLKIGEKRATYYIFK